MLAACQRLAAVRQGLWEASLSSAASLVPPVQGTTWHHSPRSRYVMGPTAAAGSCRTLSTSEGQQWLDSLVNHEAAGMPRQVDPGTSSDPPGTNHSSNNAAAVNQQQQQPTGRFDLSRMHALLAGLGNPQARVPIVHIAGTKGKGSVAAMLTAMLRAAGLRVGLYTSPHMHTIRERIQTPVLPTAAVGSYPVALDVLSPPIISETDFENLAQKVCAAAATLPPGAGPSHFEAVTAMALAHFAEAGADIAVVETGMGGATDATNVAPPESLAAAVLTAIGWDHVDALGGTLESIAAAKAGIMRPGRPAILAPQPHAVAAAVLADNARKLGATAIDAGATVSVSPTAPMCVDPGPGWHLARQSVNVDAPAEGLQLSGVEMRMVGAHQRANAATAVAAALQLRAQGWDLPDSAVAAGLSAATLPGRFQVVRIGAQGQDQPQQQPYVVLDGAHTPESATALATALREAFPLPTPLVLVVAMASDKQHRETVAALRAMRPGAVVFTAVPVGGSTARSTQPGTLVAHWQAAAMMSSGPGFRCRELIQGGMNSALPRALVEAAGLAQAAGGVHPGVVCVTGSLHAVGAADRELVAMMQRV